MRLSYRRAFLFLAERLLVITTVSAMLASTSFAQTELNPRSFLRELQNEVDFLQNANSTLHVVGTLTLGHPERAGTVAPNERSAVFRVSYFASGERLRWGQILVNKKGLASPIGFERVFVFGAGRDFVVQRLAAAKDYIVIQLGNVQENLHPGIIHKRDKVIHAAFSIAGEPAGPMVRSPHFNISKLEYVVAPDGNLVKMAFDYTSALHEPYNISGWVVLDPARHYAVREQNLRLTSPINPHINYHITGYVQYREKGKAGEAVIPEEVVFNQVDLNGKGNGSHQTFRLETSSNDPIPESEFKLGAFGLGDLERSSRRTADYGLTYSLVGVSFGGFLAGLFFKVLGRSRDGK